MRQEGLGETHSSGVIGQKLLVKDVQVHCLSRGKVERTLDPCVDKDEIEIGVVCDDLGRELGDLNR